jgi:mannose-6-phosphate isomerase
MLYPLIFEPILKDKIWGGGKLKSLFNKPALTDKLGESWELSGYEGDESVVINGNLAGKNLRELIEIYKADLVGDKNYNQYGLTFPLLFKLIDANDNLSIQVHPGDEVALNRHMSFGKTEMWYVVDAEEDAELIIGFVDDCSQEKYLQALENGTVEELLQKVRVSKGDVFFIPAGLVHAIGSGTVIAEIQQSSDITYRIYDYKRKDDNGNERELHTKLAFDVINFNASLQPKTIYRSVLNEVIPLVTCNYFNTSILRFNRQIERIYTCIDSFVVYMCFEGSFEIELAENKTIVHKGDTILIPAIIDQLTLIPTSGEVSLLEVYVM